MVSNCQKIIIPTRPHPDVIVGIFLLKEFGQKKYPGVEKCNIEIWQELPQGQTQQSLAEKGVLLLDIGNGSLDHHNKKSNLSQLIAEDLGILQDPAIAKLLAYAERDDKHGLGTISNDQLDKAFGLSGLVAALNKTIEDHQEVVNIVLPLLKAHYNEEKRRVYELPKEFQDKLDKKEAEVFEVRQNGKALKVVVLQSDSQSIAGWLKSSIGISADIVCQRKSSGHTNIMTRQQRNIDLKWLAAYLRNEEFQLREKELRYSIADLMKTGKILEIPEWYYDDATNSILNGGVNPKGVLPTIIPLDRIKNIIKESFSREVIV